MATRPSLLPLLLLLGCGHSDPFTNPIPALTSRSTPVELWCDVAAGPGSSDAVLAGPAPDGRLAFLGQVRPASPLLLAPGALPRQESLVAEGYVLRVFTVIDPATAQEGADSASSTPTSTIYGGP